MKEKIPHIVLAKSMSGSGSEAAEASATFTVEAETGQTFDLSFSLVGLLSIVVMARNWQQLQEELASLPPPTQVGR